MHTVAFTGGGIEYLGFDLKPASQVKQTGDEEKQEPHWKEHWQQSNLGNRHTEILCAIPSSRART